MKRYLVIIGTALGVAAFGASRARTVAAGGTIDGSVKSTSGAVPDAVVYLVQAPGTSAPAGPAQMDQRSMKFSPHVLPITVGTTVTFLNSDATQHNVFSPDNEKYNLGTWPQGQTQTHAYTKCAKAPCVYVQLCRIHPEMEAYIVVLQNPFFAVTDTNGAFRISNVPPGTYSVAVWADKGKAAPKSVTTDGVKPSVVDFTIAK